MKKKSNIINKKTLPEKAKEIRHYILHSRLTHKQIADKVGLKSRQSVQWYVKHYKMIKPVRDYKNK